MSNYKLFKEYILNRITRDDYRGYHLSQHNRLIFDKVNEILCTIYKVAGENTFNIHIGDDKGKEQPNCEIYYKIVKELKNKIEQTTINSLKKNIFPDLHRMGFIERFDKNDKTINVNVRKTVYKVKLSKLAIDYISNKNIKERYKLYIEATEKLLSPIIDDLFVLLYKEFDTISIWEFMFVFSDTNKKLDEKIELIQISRKLSKIQQIRLRKEIQDKFYEINKDASNKNQLRDFGNWYNETLQIFNLLNQTIYFKTFKKTILMLSLSQEALEFRAMRSENEKIKALEWHEIPMKNRGYELHHIVPISYATCKKDLDIIDDYRNLIYISKEIHNQISKRNNLLVKLKLTTDEGKRRIVLSNPFDDNICMDITEQAIFKENRIDDMISYNCDILKSRVITR